jgi:ABC-type glycerol-3-phosphate transport system substrate-binding protein
MGTRRNRLVAAGIVLGILVSCAAAWAAFAAAAPLSALMVGLDERETRAIGEVLSGAGIRFSAAAAEPGRLAEEMDRFFLPDLVFSRAGKELESASDAFAPIPAELAGTVPQALVWSVSKNGKPRALPLLVDHFEIAWTFESFAARGLSAPTDKAGFIRALAALRGGGKPVVFCAGKDDETLLLLLSAAVVARAGEDGYRRIANALGSGTPPAAVAGEGGAARAGVEELRAWRKAGLLPEDWFDFSPADVRGFMENGLAPIVLQTLSFHRTVPYQTIAAYASGPFPRLEATEKPAIVAPLTAVSVPARSYRVHRAFRAVAALATPEAGRALADASGRATAVSAARAPDLQAADALSWAAAHRSVVSGLYRDAFRDPSAAAEFARAVREELRE